LFEKNKDEYSKLKDEIKIYQYKMTPFHSIVIFGISIRKNQQLKINLPIMEMDLLKFVKK
jgi:hypothetical protein